MRARVERLSPDPIIHPRLDSTLGSNINGPSLIACPTWVLEPLGRYYLYFAHHRGAFIRLAYADDLLGPWRIHQPGCLSLSESLFCEQPPVLDGGAPSAEEIERLYLYPHVASPDVHLDTEARQIRMYFHGLMPSGEQMTRVAISSDGMSFQVRPETLGPPYFRVFRHAGYWYALALPNILLRSRDGLTAFEEGHALLEENTRHTAVFLVGDILWIIWSRIGDAPERLFAASLDLTEDWRHWRLAGAEEILRPALPWEGSTEEVRLSLPGEATRRVNELRDPFVFQEDGLRYLLYAGGGESGLGLARLEILDSPGGKPENPTTTSLY